MGHQTIKDKRLLKTQKLTLFGPGALCSFLVVKSHATG